MLYQFCRVSCHMRCDTEEKKEKKEKGNYVMYIGCCTFECVKILTPIPFLGSLPDIFIISTLLRFDLLCRLIY